MTEKGFTEIICIVDRSGSMEAMRSEAISGFNNFLDEQKKLPGKCNITYCQFDTVYDVVHDGISIKRMKPLDNSTYQPRGATALLDAVGRTIHTVGVRLANTDEDARPDNVVVVILTDGQENSSHEFSNEQIESMIRHQIDEYSWKFVYLGMGLDGFANAQSMGLYKGMAGVYVSDSAVPNSGQGLRAAYSVASSAVANTRGNVDHCLYAAGCSEEDMDKELEDSDSSS